MKRPFNFSAGPAALPLTVLEKAQAEFLNVAETGLSVLEISHRSKAFEHIIAQAEDRLRELLSIPANYQVLFLQGGASLQFSMLPLNFFAKKVAYVNSGSWASKAFKEAQIQAASRPVDVIWSGKENNYRAMPEQAFWASFDWQAAGYDYVHLTSNETIQGVALPSDFAHPGTPVLCDMSSDILSRPVNVESYDVIYAGAQKNMGPAGVTLVIVKDELLEKIPQGLPTLLDYRTHAEKGSMYNTPPVFAIYMVNLVAEWLLENGGLTAMHQKNKQQATALYDVIDSYADFYRGHADPAFRSLMNVTFTLPTPELEAQFIQEAAAQQLMSLKGHRSVGGIRASIYNACPDEAIAALCAFMKSFYQQHH